MAECGGKRREAGPDRQASSSPGERRGGELRRKADSGSQRPKVQVGSARKCL